MCDDLHRVLDLFASENRFGNAKGPLCVALLVTQHARSSALPLDPDKLVTAGGGQVLGLGKGAVQAILQRHGISRTLAAEGGRTSRNSLSNMREYVAFLNQLHRNGPVDLDAVEEYWIEKVKAFFSGQPFTIKLDETRGLRHVVSHVLEQAIARQKQGTGTNYAGAVLQHLVGAKLDCALGTGTVAHNSFATADAPQGRAGDFLVGDVAIHVTTAPGEAVIERCRDNLNAGHKPLLVTTHKRVAVAQGLADAKEIGERIDVFEIEQFVALNIYEKGGFEARGRRTALAELVTRYNEIVEEVETDPSLKIELGR